jgi:hypothetical protein
MVKTGDGDEPTGCATIQNQVENAQSGTHHRARSLVAPREGWCVSVVEQADSPFRQLFDQVHITWLVEALDIGAGGEARLDHRDLRVQSLTPGFLPECGHSVRTEWVSMGEAVGTQLFTNGDCDFVHSNLSRFLCKWGEEASLVEYRPGELPHGMRTENVVLEADHCRQRRQGRGR